MNKILLIIQREYLSRVKKKSFLLVTFGVPILIMAMYGLVFALIFKGDKLEESKKIIVVDENDYFKGKLNNTSNIEFEFSDKTLEENRNGFLKSEADYLLYLPKFKNDKPEGIEILSEKQPGFTLIGSISDQLELLIRDKKLIASGIDTNALNNLKTDVSISTKKITEAGIEDASTGATSFIGLLFSILIYMFIFVYGVQVMRGVTEEKTSRIIEVLISSVKPFQLMMGKIIGIAMVGLTQLLLWIIVTVSLGALAGTFFGGNPSEKFQKSVQTEMTQSGANVESVPPDATQVVMDALGTLNFPLLVGCFLIYFVGGYLLYSALFAAIGSAIDSDSDAQQFMFPVTIPLILSIIVSSNYIIRSPDSAVSFWFSIIPFTSPIAMMTRIPFGVPAWEIVLSVVLLIFGFIGTVWVAAKIYQTGILMYGKKPTFKELGKWLFYKN